jgi:acyl-homoserine lactone acylase PvdQ
VVIDPPEGFVVSANERADGPGGEAWVTLPEPDYRLERIRTLVAEATDLDDLVAISYDTFDRCRDRLLPIWEPLLPDEVDARQIDLPLFHALHHEAVIGLLSPHLGGARTERMFDELAVTLYYQANLDRVLALERPDLLDEAGLREVLAGAWPKARARVVNGHWPMPVRGRFKNLFTQGKLPAFLGFSTKPVTLPGGPFAPFQTRLVRMAGEEMVFGPAFHLVFDMSRKGAWYNLPGGASERRLGPGYGKGVPDWLEGRFIPLGDAEGPTPGR